VTENPNGDRKLPTTVTWKPAVTAPPTVVGKPCGDGNPNGDRNAAVTETGSDRNANDGGGKSTVTKPHRTPTTVESPYGDGNP